MRIARWLYGLGLRGDGMHTAGFASIALSILFWFRSAASGNPEKRARSERLAIFVGLWPPTFLLLGKVLQDMESPPGMQSAAAHGDEVKERVTQFGQSLSDKAEDALKR